MWQLFVDLTVVKTCGFQHAPGVPKILVGNRCHLAFKREVSELVAEEYAQRHDMTFLEVSPLCNFNVMESLVELSRVALQRNGMSRAWGINRGMSHTAVLCQRLCSSSFGPLTSTWLHLIYDAGLY